MGENAWVIQVDEEVKQMSDIRQTEKKWAQRCIYKLPTCVTNLNENAYKPRAVSFGPYHHFDQNLKALEDHKHQVLLHFLKRSKKTLRNYVDALNIVVQDLMGAYDSLDPFWLENKDKFLQLMIRDGCFILEILRTPTQSKNEDNGYARNDPIFSNHGKLCMMPYIEGDMLVLENQLPLLVLDKLLAVENPEIQDDEEFTNRLVLKFCFPQFPDDDIKHMRLGKCLHVLHVYRKGLLLEVHSTSQVAEAAQQSPTNTPPGDNASLFEKMGNNSGGNGCGGRIGSGGARASSSAGESRISTVAAAGEIFGSARELEAAGIRFEMSKTVSLKDITFKAAGIRFEMSKTVSLEDIFFKTFILGLPPIAVDDRTELVFRNLMAFERFHAGAGKEVTEYIYFMGNVIRNSEDISLLRHRRIIRNGIVSDEAAAQLFNSLSTGVPLDPDGSLGIVHRDVNKYYGNCWNQWRGSVLLTHLQKPVTLITVYGLLFTILQTVYTIRQYYKE